jgi:hypothetical protein
MHAIIELTPLTARGEDILHQLESTTGRLPFRAIEASGAKAYYLERPVSVDRFEAVLCRMDRDWHVHLALKLLPR